MKTIIASLFILAACGTDPISYSAPVGIELGAKSGDVSMNVVTEQKDITTESGNPYGSFINQAMTKLGGKTPSRIALDDLTLTLGAQSSGVSSLEEILTGDVDVAFLVNNSNNTYDAGHVSGPMGVGPVSMTPSFDWSMVASQDIPQIMNGSFKVVLRGSAASAFSTKGANATLQVTFTFSAFQ